MSRRLICCFGFTSKTETSCIRSVCDHAAPVFHASLQQYLIDDLERVQKGALAIISPTSSYLDAPAALDLESLDVYHRRLSQSLLESVLKDKDHHLHHLLPALPSTTVYSQACQDFDANFITSRARNSFINFHCLRANSFGQPSDFN